MAKAGRKSKAFSARGHALGRPHAAAKAERVFAAVGRATVTREPVRKLSGKAWVAREYNNDRDTLLGMGITRASEKLSKKSQKATDTKPMTPRYVERLLRDLGYPRAFRGRRSI